MITHRLLSLHRHTSLRIQHLVNPGRLVFDVFVFVATQKEHLGLDLTYAVHSVQGRVHGLWAGGFVVRGEGRSRQVGLLHRGQDVGQERSPAENERLVCSGP